MTLVEAVGREGRLTQRTLFRLGKVSELRESGQLDRIVKALATYAKATYVEVGEIEGLSSPSFGAVAAAWSYFRQLGFEEHFSSVGDGRRLSPATFDEHEGDTITEHRFVNVLSSPCSSW